MRHETILVTGGAGFIGSELVRQLINNSDSKVIIVDKLTYAGNMESLSPVAGNKRFHFAQKDIANQEAMQLLFGEHKPGAVINLAAESHVDRSIDDPASFLKTNIMGTYSLLEASRGYWQQLSGEARDTFRFLHVSTDEVYGSLGSTGLFTEKTAYAPNSPYSASKASSDHLVRAWHETYGLPTITTNCSNNYGPYQFPEKLIPLMILNALEGKPLPVYGDGGNIRDWLYVGDHVHALRIALEKGQPGQTYNIGGNCEKRNIEVVNKLCELLSANPETPDRDYHDLITYVTDRPGHDRRYAIDSSKISRELGWAPKESFETGLSKTVEWYLANLDWCRHIEDGSYRRNRLGLGGL